MVHIDNDTLGATIKSARQSASITQEQLAERLGISARYIMSIENAHKKPKYDLLFQIIRELHIQPDLIFYPEKPANDSEREELIRMIYSCDEKSLPIIKATVSAVLDNQKK